LELIIRRWYQLKRLFRFGSLQCLQLLDSFLGRGIGGQRH
jgi:hypothetical protein